MNKLLSLIITLGCLGLAGCESMSSVSDRMGERINARTAGVTRIFPGQQRDIHAAAKVAVAAIGFKITRAGAAQGHIEAISALQSENGLKGSRQLTMKVKMEQVGEGVQVRAAFSEIIEENFDKGPGMGTETPLLDTPLYEVFFRALEKQLPAATPLVPTNP